MVTRFLNLPHLTVVPRVHIPASLIPGNSVTLLDLALELITPAIDDIKVLRLRRAAHGARGCRWTTIFEALFS